MSVRRPTLDEWFSAYQLEHLTRTHVHLPGFIDVDVSAIAARHRSRGAPIPYTAIVVKGLALVARRLPEINRCYLKTILGPRVIEFERVSVNLPVLMAENGREFLSAITVHDADAKPLSEIVEELRRARHRPLDDTRITKIVARRPNTLWWRTVLRAIHFAAYNFPSKFEALGGGLSVSSLLWKGPGVPGGRISSYGPTALTLAVTGVRETEDGRVNLELGVGMDHSIMAGITYRRFTAALADVFALREPELATAFD